MNMTFAGQPKSTLRYPIYMGAMVPGISDENLVKWVVVPGATVATLFLLTRILKRKKGRKR